MDLYSSVSADKSLLGSIGLNPTLTHDQKNTLPMLPFRQQVPQVCYNKFRELRSWLCAIPAFVSKSAPADLRHLWLPSSANRRCERSNVF